MILVVNSLRVLDFSQLTRLYEDDIEQDRRRHYAHMDAAEGRFCAENDLYHYLRDCFFGQNNGAYYIYEENGKYLSAFRIEQYLDGLLINALITDEGHRNKGLASDLLNKLFESVTVPVYAHIYRKNMASLAIHRKFGFKKHADHAVMLDGSVCNDHITYIRYN